MPPNRPRLIGPTQRTGSFVWGGQPVAPPLVATVGYTNLTPSSVNLVGSVNPQGQAGTVWFTYGTTSAMGTITAAQALAATSIPQTVTVAINGLTAGAEYWFATVGQTAGGTVTAIADTFVAQTPPVVTDAGNPLPTSITPAVAVPHWRFPISFNPATGISVVEQDSLDEVFSNVQAIMACQVGQCPELPTFGYHDPTFGQTPLNPAQLIADIQRLEPRATESVLSQAPVGVDPNGGSWGMGLTTSYAGGGI